MIVKVFGLKSAKLFNRCISIQTFVVHAFTCNGCLVSSNVKVRSTCHRQGHVSLLLVSDPPNQGLKLLDLDCSNNGMSISGIARSHVLCHYGNITVSFQQSETLEGVEPLDVNDDILVSKVTIPQAIRTW